MYMVLLITVIYIYNMNLFTWKYTVHESKKSLKCSTCEHLKIFYHLITVHINQYLQHSKAIQSTIFFASENGIKWIILLHYIFYSPNNTYNFLHISIRLVCFFIKTFYQTALLVSSTDRLSAFCLIFISNNQIYPLSKISLKQIRQKVNS